MYVLDTDTTTHYFSGSKPTIQAKVLSVPPSTIWLPVIVVEEQLKGRLKVIAGLNAATPRDGPRFIAAYQFLIKTIEDLTVFRILPYTEEGDTLFRSWSAAQRRPGTRDCRIAAIAMTNGFTLVTCNTRHFESIPGIKVEDWSLEPLSP